jgi:hypothetical protein
LQSGAAAKLTLNFLQSLHNKRNYLEVVTVKVITVAYLNTVVLVLLPSYLFLASGGDPCVVYRKPLSAPKPEFGTLC